MSTLRKYLDIITEGQTLTEGRKNVVRIPSKKVRWSDDGDLNYPTVKGLDSAEWQAVDYRAISDIDGVNVVADMAGHFGLKIYVIDDTGGDYFWMAMAK